MRRIKQEWSKSFLIRPRDNIQSHILIRSKRFVPSYENDPCPIPMSWLLGWEYARIWLRERDEFVAQRERKAKPKRIKNDYEKWLEKHRPKPKKAA